MKRLASRPRSIREIESDLDEKGFATDVTGEVIATLLERRLLDDSVLARDIVVQGQRGNKGWSRIYADLRKRGLSRNLAEQSLEEFYDAERERESIAHLVKTSSYRFDSTSNESELNKIMRRVSGKGFSPGHARDIIYEMTCDKEHNKGTELP